MMLNRRFGFLVAVGLGLASGRWVAAAPPGNEFPVFTLADTNSFLAGTGVGTISSNAPPKLKSASGMRMVAKNLPRPVDQSVDSQAFNNRRTFPAATAGLAGPLRTNGYYLSFIRPLNSANSGQNLTPAVPIIAVTNSPPVSPETFCPPGVYWASPYSGLVLVPEPIDSALVIAPPAGATLDDCAKVPNLHLEPKE